MMHVRISYTVTVDSNYLRALAHQEGSHGAMATRQDVKDQHYLSGFSEDNDIMQEWQDCDEGCDADRFLPKQSKARR